MQNRTKQTRRHYRRTSLYGPNRHAEHKDDKRHPARLFIWSPRDTVQALGQRNRHRLGTRLTVGSSNKNSGVDLPGGS